MFIQPASVPLAVKKLFQEITESKFLMDGYKPSVLLSIFKSALAHAQHLALDKTFSEKLSMIKIDPVTRFKIESFTIKILLFPKIQKKDSQLVDNWISQRHKGNIQATVEEIQAVYQELATLPENEQHDLYQLCLPLWVHFPINWTKIAFIKEVMAAPPIIRERVLKMIEPFLAGLEVNQAHLFNFFASLHPSILAALQPYAKEIKACTRGEQSGEILSILINAPNEHWDPLFQKAKKLLAITSPYHWASHLKEVSMLTSAEVDTLIRQTNQLQPEPSDWSAVFGCLNVLNPRDREDIINHARKYAELIDDLRQFVNVLMVIKPENRDEALKLIADYYNPHQYNFPFVKLLGLTSERPFEEWKVFIKLMFPFLKTLDGEQLYEAASELIKSPLHRINDILKSIEMLTSKIKLKENQYNYFVSRLIPVLEEIHAHDLPSVITYALRTINSHTASGIYEWDVTAILKAWSKIPPENREALYLSIANSSFSNSSLSEQTTLIGKLSSCLPEDMPALVQDCEIAVSSITMYSLEHILEDLCHIHPDKRKFIVRNLPKAIRFLSSDSGRNECAKAFLPYCHDGVDVVDEAIKIEKGYDRCNTSIFDALYHLAHCSEHRRQELVSICASTGLDSSERRLLLRALLDVQPSKWKGLVEAATPFFSISGYKNIERIIPFLNQFHETEAKELVEDAFLFGSAYALEIISFLSQIKHERRLFLYNELKKLFPNERVSVSALRLINRISASEIEELKKLAEPILSKTTINRIYFLEQVSKIAPSERQEMFHDILLLPDFSSNHVEHMIAIDSAARKAYLQSLLLTTPPPEVDVIKNTPIRSELHSLSPYINSLDTLNELAKKIPNEELAFIVTQLLKVEEAWGGTGAVVKRFDYLLTLHPKKRESYCCTLISLLPLATRVDEIETLELIARKLKQNAEEFKSDCIALHAEFPFFDKTLLMVAVCEFGKDKIKSFLHIPFFADFREEIFMQCVNKFDAENLQKVYAAVNTHFPYQAEPLSIDTLEILVKLPTEKLHVILSAAKKIYPVIRRDVKFKEQLTTLIDLHDKNLLHTLDLLPLFKWNYRFDIKGIATQLKNDELVKGIERANYFYELSIEEIVKISEETRSLTDSLFKDILTVLRIITLRKNYENFSFILQLTRHMSQEERLECAAMTHYLYHNRCHWNEAFSFLTSLTREKRKAIYPAILLISDRCNLDSSIFEMLAKEPGMEAAILGQWLPWFHWLDIKSLKIISRAYAVGFHPKDIPCTILNLTADKAVIVDFVDAITQVSQEHQEKGLITLLPLLLKSSATISTINIYLHALKSIDPKEWEKVSQILIEGTKDFANPQDPVNNLLTLYKESKELPDASFNRLFEIYPAIEAHTTLLIELAHLSYQERMNIVQHTNQISKDKIYFLCQMWILLAKIPEAEREEFFTLIHDTPLSHITRQKIGKLTRQERRAFLKICQETKNILSSFSDFMEQLIDTPSCLWEKIYADFKIMQKAIASHHSLAKALFKISDLEARQRAIHLALPLLEKEWNVHHTDLLIALSRYEPDTTLTELEKLVEPFYEVVYDRDIYYELIIFFSFYSKAERSDCAYLIPLLQATEKVDELFRSLLFLDPVDRKEATRFYLCQKNSERSIQHLFLNHASIRERAYTYLSNQLDKNLDPVYLALLSKKIWDNNADFLLQDEHPLTQKALNVWMIADPEVINNPSNPFFVFNRLKQLYKDEPFFTPSPSEYPHSLNLQTVRERGRVEKYTFADIPAEAHPRVFHVIVEDFEKRIAGLSDEKRGDVLNAVFERTGRSLAKLIEDFFGFPLITQLLNATGKPEDPIEPYAYQLFMIMKALLREDNSIKENELLTPREIMLIIALTSISDCIIGQREGITNAFNQLPIQYRTSTALPQPEARAAAVVAAAINQYSEAICGSREILNKIDSTIEPNPHTTLLIRNRLAKHIGLQNFSIVFDPHSISLHRELIESNKFFVAFMECCTVASAIKFVQRNIAEGLASSLVRYRDLEYLLDGVRGTVRLAELFVTDADDTPTGVTPEGARLLLKALKYID